MDLNGSKMRYKCYLMLYFLGGVATTQVIEFIWNDYNYTYNHGLIGFCVGYVLTFLCGEPPKLDIVIDENGVSGLKGDKWYKMLPSKKVIKINFTNIDKIKSIGNNRCILGFFRSGYVIYSKNGDFIRISELYYGFSKSKKIHQYLIGKV